MLSLNRCQLEPTWEFTPGPGVQHTEHDLVTSPGQGLSNRGSGSQSGLLPYMQRCNEVAGLDKFGSMALPLARLHSHPLQFWHKENYKMPGDLLRGLKPDPEASHALNWWCIFKPQAKSIWKPLIEEVVTTDISKERRAEKPTSISRN